jgi:hypothetical protein
MIVGGAPWPLFGALVSLRRAISVHTLVGEVDNGVRRVGEAMADRASANRGVPRAWPCVGPRPVAPMAGLSLV